MMDIASSTPPQHTMRSLKITPAGGRERDAEHTMEGEGIYMTFSELRAREVINICDGRRLGRACDIGLDEHARAVCLILPCDGGWRGMCRGNKPGLVIGWDRIRRIGDDVILVELLPQEAEN